MSDPTIPRQLADLWGDALVQPDGSGRERCAQALQRYGLGAAAPALGGEKPLDRPGTAFARSAQARCESVSGLEGSSEQQPTLPLGCGSTSATNGDHGTTSFISSRNSRVRAITRS
jgi:hypothetical protein